MSPAPTRTKVRSGRSFFFALTRACWGLSLGGCICACARACVGTRRTSRINPHTGRQLNFWHLSVYPSIHLLHQILGYHVGAAISANCISTKISAVCCVIAPLGSILFQFPTF